jgi:hypothetical protein
MPKQRGLLLPDPNMPTGNFELPVPLRIVSPRWRFRAPAPLYRGCGITVLVIMGFAVIADACAVRQRAFSAIAR